MATTYWDRPARLTFGKPDQTLTLRGSGGLRTVNVPGGMTPREFAGIIHAHDGYEVVGFGYGVGDIHPDDCMLCGEDTVNEPHGYIGSDY